MNTLSGILRKSGRDIFENILEVVAISLMASMIVFPGVFLLPPGPGAIYILFTASPALFAAFYAMDVKLRRKPFKYSLFFKGFKIYYGKAFFIGLLFIILSVIPISSWWYYARIKTVFSFVIAMFQSYLYLMILMALTYIIPVIIRENRGISYSVKTSFTLFLDNPGYTIGSFIQIISITILLVITIVSFPMLFPGMFSIFVLNLHENLLLKYQKLNGQ